MSTRHAWGLALALALPASGCDPDYARVSIYKLDGEVGSRASASGGLRLSAGDVLVFEAHPRSEVGEAAFVGFERFGLRASESDVAVVRRAILADTWVVNGVARGSTTMQILLDGDVVDSLPIEVED